ncbi:MAG: NrsF family protein [Xanthobacteraceae bacterium]
MKTDDLIRALSADNATRAASVERWLSIAVVPALVLSAFMFAMLLGPRSDIALVATDFKFLFKFVVTLTLAVTATLLACRLVRPGRDAKFPAIALAAAPLLLAIAVLNEYAAVEPATRTMKLVGTTWRSCLTFIPLLSAPILLAALIGLRHGAPTRPALAGAVAGLMAGGFGAAIYAAYCIEDSPFFLATWYTIAIAAVALVGALIGARVLRW